MVTTGVYRISSNKALATLATNWNNRQLIVLQQTSNATASMGTAAAIQVYNVARYITQTPVLASGSNIDTTQQISNMELYINAA